MESTLLADAPMKCEDALREAEYCPVWKQYGACKSHAAYLRKFCAKTCDLCRPPAPPIPVLPKCAKGPYGCCWDNQTMAKGPTDSITTSQCSPCLDRRSSRFCTMFQDICSNKIIGQGDIMRKECPITCGVPCHFNINLNTKDKCQDLEGFENRCIQWFQAGKCSTDAVEMQQYCRKSCGICL